ncbi:MAG: hypothetical protein KGS60_04635 [Verrucomicrobia bacterium]|nr:hypothetical protein [Verrucomicrobiota bacterium]
MFEGSSYLAVSALGITLLTALAFLTVGVLVGWILWRRPCGICEEQLLRARAQLEDMDALERENLELRQKLARLAETSTSDASGPLLG